MCVSAPPSVKWKWSHFACKAPHVPLANTLHHFGCSGWRTPAHCCLFTLKHVGQRPFFFCWKAIQKKNGNEFEKKRKEKKPSLYSGYSIFRPWFWSRVHLAQIPWYWKVRTMLSALTAGLDLFPERGHILTASPLFCPDWQKPPCYTAWMFLDFSIAQLFVSCRLIIPVPCLGTVGSLAENGILLRTATSFPKNGDTKLWISTVWIL